MLKNFDREATAVFTVLVISATYAAALGFVSPDSWNYVRLAQSSIKGELCQVNGEYFAVFPCGYPIALAISSLSTNASTIIIVSKFTNALLLFLSFILLRRFFSAFPTLSALVIISPLTLFVSRFTWSENLFIFATALTLHQLKRLSLKMNPINLVILQLALILGISSRYFFAPFAFLIWLSAFKVYGKTFAFKTTPVFVVSGLFFLGYYSLNKKITGFSTGMERIESPESKLFLVAKFIHELFFRQIPVLVIVLLIFYAVARKKIALNSPKRKYLQKDAELLLTFLSGISFLALAFLLRLFTQYDLYDVRTMGFGVTLVLVSSFGFFANTSKMKNLGFSALFATALLSLSIVSRSDIQSLALSLINGNSTYVSVSNQINTYENESSLRGVDNVVAIAVPEVGEKIASNPSLYYGIETNVIQPSVGPYSSPESLEEFLHRVDNVVGECVIDFSMFPTRESLLEVLNKWYAVGIRFDFKARDFVTVRKNGFDTQLSGKFEQVFRPGGIAKCSELRG